MKRDMDLIRDILKLMEANDDPTGIGPITIEGRGGWLINYHIALLAEAEFIQALKVETPGHGTSWKAQELKWAGHEFLDATRDDSVWEKVKGTVKKNGGSFTASILTQLAVGYLKEQFHLH